MFFQFRQPSHPPLLSLYRTQSWKASLIRLFSDASPLSGRWSYPYCKASLKRRELASWVLLIISITFFRTIRASSPLQGPPGVPGWYIPMTYPKKIISISSFLVQYCNITSFDINWNIKLPEQVITNKIALQKDIFDIPDMITHKYNL